MDLNKLSGLDLITYIRKLEKKVVELEKTIDGFQDIISLATPRIEDYPRLEGIDYYARTIPLEGRLGGDHLMFVNFEKLAREVDQFLVGDVDREEIVQGIRTKNSGRFGIALIDVFGHGMAESVAHYYLHAAITAALPYELIMHQEVTRELFEKINTIWFNHIQLSSGSINKIPFATMLYGEIHDSGAFRFLSAGHPPPIIYSREYGRIQKLHDRFLRASTPLGVIPSQYNLNTGHFNVNELHLMGKGDILLLYTDGFIEQDNGRKNFAETRLEEVLREIHDFPAKSIYGILKTELQKYSPIEDDLTLAVIKKK